jgi:glycosyltransferase involved in cell wall biosynthesis
MDYHANVDAVAWFAQEVFPAIRTSIPDARFYVVGGRPTEAVRALARQQGVNVTGAVPDVRPYLRHAHVAVAPLRVARGVQNKVLEAMAMARRVVVTPQAAEGIQEFDGLTRDCMPDARSFADRCIELIRAHAVTADENRDFVCRHYDWERNLSRLEPLLGTGHAPRPANVTPFRRSKVAS